MLIINTTYHVSKTVEHDWVNWVKKDYIPAVIKTGLLVRPRFHQVFMDGEDNSNAYALQFEVENFEKLEYWSNQFGKKLKTTLSEMFEEKVLGFTTLMEVIDLDI